MSRLWDTLALSGSPPAGSPDRTAHTLAAESVGTHSHRPPSRPRLVLWATAPCHRHLDGDARSRGGPADVDRRIGHPSPSGRGYLLLAGWGGIWRQRPTTGLVRGHAHRRLEWRSLGPLLAWSRAIPHHHRHPGATAFTGGGRRGRRLSRFGLLEAGPNRCARSDSATQAAPSAPAYESVRRPGGVVPRRCRRTSGGDRHTDGDDLFRENPGYQPRHAGNHGQTCRIDSSPWRSRRWPSF